MDTNQTYGSRPQDAAKDEAGHVADKAKSAAQDVAGSAQEEARATTEEATNQIKSLVSSARDEAMAHASTQQTRLAGQSRVISDDLQRISRGERPESELVSSILSTVASRAERLTSELENKEPADLLRDVRRFAARRPAAFLAVAAGVGLLAGRLTRGLSDSEEGEEKIRRPEAPAETPVETPAPSIGFDHTPQVTPLTEDTGVIPGELGRDVETPLDPFAGFDHLEDRR